MTTSCFGFESSDIRAADPHRHPAPALTFLSDELSSSSSLHLFSAYGERQQLFSRPRKESSSLSPHPHPQCSSDCGGSAKTFHISAEHRHNHAPHPIIKQLQRYKLDDCAFCRGNGSQSDQQYRGSHKQRTNTIIPSWRAHLNNKLYLKYASSQNYYYTRDINDILVNARSPVVILLKDTLTLDEEGGEYLKRYYAITEHERKARLLAEYYKFHRDIPRIFMQPQMIVLNNFHDKKRKLEYFRIAQIIQEENNNNPERPPKGIVGEKLYPNPGGQQRSHDDDDDDEDEEDRSESSFHPINHQAEQPKRGSLAEQVEEELLLNDISSFINRGNSSEDHRNQGLEVFNKTARLKHKNSIDLRSSYLNGSHFDLPTSSRQTRRESLTTLVIQSSSNASVNQMLASRRHHQQLVPETAQLAYQRKLAMHGAFDQQQQRQSSSSSKNPQDIGLARGRGSEARTTALEDNNTLRELNNKLEEIVNVASNSSSSMFSHSQISLSHATAAGGAFDDQQLEEFLIFLNGKQQQQQRRSQVNQRNGHYHSQQLSGTGGATASAATSTANSILSKPRTMNTIHFPQEKLGQIITNTEHAPSANISQIPMSSTPRAVYGIPASSIISMMSNNNNGDVRDIGAQKLLQLNSAEMVRVQGQFTRPSKMSDLQELIVEKVKQSQAQQRQERDLFKEEVRAQQQLQSQLNSQQPTGSRKDSGSNMFTPRSPLVNSLVHALTLQSARQKVNAAAMAVTVSAGKKSQHSSDIPQCSPRNSTHVLSTHLNNAQTKHVPPPQPPSDNSLIVKHQTQSRQPQVNHSHLIKKPYITCASVSDSCSSLMITESQTTAAVTAAAAVSQAKKKQQLQQQKLKSHHVQTVKPHITSESQFLNQKSLRLKLDQLSLSKDRATAAVTTTSSFQQQPQHHPIAAAYSNNGLSSLAGNQLTQRSGSSKQVERTPLSQQNTTPKYNFFEMIKQSAMCSGSSSPPQHGAVANNHIHNSNNMSAYSSALLLHTKNNHSSTTFPLQTPFALEIITSPHEQPTPSMRISSQQSSSNSHLKQQQQRDNRLSNSPKQKTKVRSKGKSGESMNTSPGANTNSLIAARKSHPVLFVSGEGLKKSSSKSLSSNNAFTKSVIIEKGGGQLLSTAASGHIMLSTRRSSPEIIDGLDDVVISLHHHLDGFKMASKSNQLRSNNQPYLQQTPIVIAKGKEHLHRIAKTKSLKSSSHKHTKSENFVNSESLFFDSPPAALVQQKQQMNPDPSKRLSGSWMLQASRQKPMQLSQANVMQLSQGAIQTERQIKEQQTVVTAPQKQSSSSSQQSLKQQLASPLLSQRNSKQMITYVDQFRSTNNSTSNPNNSSYTNNINANHQMNKSITQTLNSFISVAQSQQQPYQQKLQQNHQSSSSNQQQQLLATDQSYMKPFSNSPPPTQWQSKKDFLTTSATVPQIFSTISGGNHFFSPRTSSSSSNSIVQPLATCTGNANQHHLLLLQQHQQLSVKNTHYDPTHLRQSVNLKGIGFITSTNRTKKKSMF